MRNIIISGSSGKVGKVLAGIISARTDCKVCGGIDMRAEGNEPFPVFENPLLVNIDADVIIDFSHPSNIDALIELATTRNIPLVVATTGYSQEDITKIKAAAEKIPVFFTANMSLGVNLIAQLSQMASVVLGDSFDIEIIEKHHNQKIDSPSGTALLLADAISGALPYSPKYVYDRHVIRKKRDKNEIGIASIRGGTISGEHEVIFAGNDEVISISHSALSKNVFASGAVSAALFLCEREKGLYDMGDLLKMC